MSGPCCTNAGKAVDACTTAGDVMLLSCSGGSNVGQLANQACAELTQEGFGKMFCLAAIGGNLPDFVRSAKEVPKVVVLDGCGVGCAKAIFEKAGLPLRGHLVLTDLGIAKNKDLNPRREELDQVKAAARRMSQG